jgi:integrase
MVSAIAAAPDFAALVHGALYTCLRIGDLTKLKWDMISGGWISLVPQKTRRLKIKVEIPVFAYPPMKALFESLPRVGDYVFTRAGRPWNTATARDHWDRGLPAPLAHLHFHDLRGTAVTRLLEAGCTDAEVAVVADKRIGQGTITAYAARTRKLALNAYAKLNAADQMGNVIELHATTENSGSQAIEFSRHLLNGRVYASPPRG